MGIVFVKKKIYCCGILIVLDTKYAKGSKFFIGHELRRVAKLLINMLPKITKYVQGYDGNTYVTIINNK